MEDASGIAGVGDIRLDLQFEQRMHINDLWQVALFSDMGNVWLHGEEAPEASVWSWGLRGFGWGLAWGFAWTSNFFCSVWTEAFGSTRAKPKDKGGSDKGRGKVPFIWVWACLSNPRFQVKNGGEMPAQNKWLARRQTKFARMVWFKRNAEGITTSSAEKKEIPEGAWYKCPNCKTVVSNQDHANNLWVCAMCDHHERIGSHEYFGILFDEGKYREVAPKLQATDPLSFEDTKAYTDRLSAAASQNRPGRCHSRGVGRASRPRKW